MNGLAGNVLLVAPRHISIGDTSPMNEYPHALGDAVIFLQRERSSAPGVDSTWPERAIVSRQPFVGMTVARVAEDGKTFRRPIDGA